MKIQASIAGFTGQPITLMAVYSEDSGIFFVAKQIKFREDRALEGALLISNMDLPTVDSRFTDADFSGAIGSYFDLVAMRALDIDSDLQRFKPDNKIEVDKVDESGKKYRISPEIDNGQIAVLAIAACAAKQRSISAAMDMHNELQDIFNEIITI